MSRWKRSLAIVAAATAVTAAIGAAAVASTPRQEMTDWMGGQLPAHMENLSDQQFSEMDDMMDSGASHDQMHAWMTGRDDAGRSS